MTSTKRTVTLDGILTGQGLESTCIVSAVEVTHVGTGQTALARLKIQRVAKALPEGKYELSCNGEKTMVNHEDGFWLATTA
jgi:hypothetical protein